MRHRCFAENTNGTKELMPLWREEFPEPETRKGADHEEHRMEEVVTRCGNSAAGVCVGFLAGGLGRAEPASEGQGGLPAERGFPAGELEAVSSRGNREASAPIEGGLDDKTFSSPWGSIFLDIPSYRTGLSVMIPSTQQFGPRFQTH